MAGFAPEVPRTLAGRYRLVRLLARGGMAEVWEGRDDVLSRPVAVKMLLPHLAADPNLIERFKREAVTAARLVHPGIVAVFDAGVEAVDGTVPVTGSFTGPLTGPGSEGTWGDGASTAFIVMELVPGETLRDLIRRSGPLDPRLVVAICAQVADALAYAHSQGLVHRDIKPANVLLRDEGHGLAQVKVADFGIAKATSTTGDLTADGALLGTPKYVSPEQVRGEEPDARADLYSLGVVMFEMLAGRPPFEGGADMATALAHVQRPAPSLALARPGLSRPLVDLVATLLEKEPERRLPSAGALLRSLAEAGRHLGSPVGGAGTFLDLGAAAQARPPRAPAGGHADLSPDSREQPTEVVGTKTEVGGRSAGSPARGRRSREKRRRAKGRRRTGLTSAVVGSLLVAGACVAGVLAYPSLVSPPAQSGQGGKGAGSTPATTSAGGGNRGPVVGVRGVRELAIGGNKPNDNLGALQYLTDGNPSTYWQSDLYNGPDFGRYGGFGLALQLDGTHRLQDLAVITPMQGWSAEAFVSDGFADNLSAWGKPLSRQGSIHGDHTFPLDGKSGSWVLLWMTNPGPTDQATVDELSVTSG